MRISPTPVYHAAVARPAVTQAPAPVLRTADGPPPEYGPKIGSLPLE